LADQFDAMRGATAFLQADADVGRESGHVSDPFEVATVSRRLRYDNSSCTRKTPATSRESSQDKNFVP
jgi:hypothetical protein